MKIKEKERGHVVETFVDDEGIKRLGTSGWAIWEFDFE